MEAINTTIKHATQPRTEFGNDASDNRHDPDYMDKLIIKDCDTEKRDTWFEPVDVFREVAVTDFPDNILPDEIERFIREQSRCMGSDRNGLAIFVLASCAAAISDEIKLQPKPNDPTWFESARVWAALVGDPSIRKTPIMRAAMRPIYKIAEKWRDEDSQAIKDYEVESKIYSKQLDKYVKDTANGNAAAKPVEPEKPESRKAYFDETTIERVFDVLSGTNRGTLLIQDELSGFFGGMDAYRANGASKDRSHWLQAYNGGRRELDRVNGGTKIVPNFSVSIAGGIQPAPMKKIANKLDDDGLLQRFNIVIGRPAGLDDDDYESTAYQSYTDLVIRLTALAAPYAPIPFNREAQLIFRDFRKRVNAFEGIGSLSLKLRTHLGKWNGQFCRYALILHCVHCVSKGVNPADYPIGADTASKVTRLFWEFFYQHAVVFYDEILCQSGQMEHIRWIAGHLLTKPNQERISSRDLKRAYRAIRDASDWDIHYIMDTLTTFGWVESEELKTPRKHWKINPAIFEVFAKRAKYETKRRQEIMDIFADVAKRPVKKKIADA